MRDSDGSYRRDGAVPDGQVHLLGFPEAHVAGTPLTLSDQKAYALMLYLAAIGEARSGDHLAILLWSESPESNARHSLGSSLYHIRHALGASVRNLPSLRGFAAAGFQPVASVFHVRLLTVSRTWLVRETTAPPALAAALRQVYEARMKRA